MANLNLQDAKSVQNTIKDLQAMLRGDFSKYSEPQQLNIAIKELQNVADDLEEREADETSN